MSNKEKAVVVSMKAAKVMKDLQKSMEAEESKVLLDYVKLSGTHMVERRIRRMRAKKV